VKASGHAVNSGALNPLHKGHVDLGGAGPSTLPSFLSLDQTEMMTHEENFDVPRGRAGVTVASPSLAILPVDECWSVLKSHSLGRLSILIKEWPRIFPVDYAVGEGALVFRTDVGTKLEYGPGSPACFEVDGYDERHGAGWSVMAVGMLEDVTGNIDERSQRLRRLAVRSTAPGQRSHWLALAPKELTGRSFQGGWVVPGNYFG